MNKEMAKLIRNVLKDYKDGKYDEKTTLMSLEHLIYVEVKNQNQNMRSDIYGEVGKDVLNVAMRLYSESENINMASHFADYIRETFSKERE